MMSLLNPLSSKNLNPFLTSFSAPDEFRAFLYLSLGNRDEAVRWLEQVIADRDSPNIDMITVDPWLDPLREDPRFDALVRKVVGPKQK